MTRYTQATIDLVSLIEQKAGISLVKKSNHFLFGVEYCGPCPFCKGGDDRFLVWPDGDRPHFYCRRCEREGSPSQFLEEYCDISYGEALALLGVPDEDAEHDYSPPSLSDILSKGMPPSKAWQEAAMVVVDRAERYLWHPASVEGQQALTYLRGRGLRDETIKSKRFGCMPLDRTTGRWWKESFEVWGIDRDTLREDLRAKGGVRVPNGIVIPWLEDTRLWKLVVKRPGEQMSYGQVLGSSDGGLYNVSSVAYGKPVMLVEGELDALSVEQEAGDLISCVATGSTSKGRDGRWRGELNVTPFQLQSFDADAAGDDASEFWTHKLERCTRWRPWADEEGKRFKDPNEMLQYATVFKQFTGYTLRGWVESGIEAASPPEPPDDAEASKEDIVPPPDVEPSEQPEEAENERSDAELEQFASTVAKIANVFGGATITKQPIGLTLEAYARTIRKPYTPVTLEALPRKACPHTPPCKGMPLQHGWCVEHERSHDLLILGALLGYPAIEVPLAGGYGQTAHRCIGTGVAQWEGYAEVAPGKWLVRDIMHIRATFRMAPARLFV